MQFSASAPIYRQVMDAIKRDMATGTLSPGARADSVRAMAQRYGINLNTMQRACSELEREGLLTTRRGVGSFVTEDRGRLDALREEMARELERTYLEGMEGLGFTWAEAVRRLRGEEEGP